LIRPQRFILALLFAVALGARLALADAYDPPATYYSPAAGLTGISLKQKLRAIIDATNDPDSVVPNASEVVATPMSYDAARSSLQVTDADPNQSGWMLSVYDRVSINVSAINPGGPIPGWDNGVTWNREHTWPRSRGVESSGPDDSDLFGLRPALSASNGDRGNLNFGGAFGAQSWGVVNDGGQKWYPGDADAGTIARQQFYMAVRYDGGDTNTTDLELFSGNPSTSQGLGDLDRLLQWHYAAPPDSFERRRNQVIFDSYQHNRNPFTDHPEYAWSIFVNQTNDSQLTLAAPTTINATTGASTKTINLPSVIVGGAVPGAQTVTLNKSGNNGTYYSVTASGLATSTVTGPFNAFRIITGGTDSKSFNVGLNTNTATAGLRTGTVTIDNLDITPGSNGGVGRAANDANDVITVNLNVLDHATPLFASNQATSLTLDFGNIALGDGTPSLNFGILNKVSTASFTAGLDLDSFTPSGNMAAFTTSLSPFSSLAAGSTQAFSASFIASTVGTFTANYTLNLSDENLSGATNKSITLTLTGKTRLAGDYNGDLVVDMSDYVVWRAALNQSTLAYAGADGDGNGSVGPADYDVWRAHFGQTAAAVSGASLPSTVPEPTAALLALLASAAIAGTTDRRSTRARRPLV